MTVEDIMTPFADYLDCKIIFNNSNNIYKKKHLCICKGLKHICVNKHNVYCFTLCFQ